MTTKEVAELIELTELAFRGFHINKNLSQGQLLDK